MKLYKIIFEKNACYKAGKKIVPKGIMVHSTGANNPNLKRYIAPDDGLIGKNTLGNHWNRSGVSKCVHAFIGKQKDGSVATYQVLPWDHRGWHCGKSGNDTHISFEICEDNLKDATYFAKVYREAVELCAYLCKKYNLTEKDILCHSEGYKKGIASNHSDVMHWFPKHGKSMDTFRADVRALLGGEVAEEAFAPYLVKITASVLNVRAGAGTNYKVTTTVKKGGVYTIVDEKMNGSTKWGKLKSGAGWISLKYCDKQ